MIMKNICIYHASCADGFGAALAVKLHFDSLDEECEFLLAHYGDEAPNVNGMNVVIVDFSYPRDVLTRMNEQASKMVVLDHHKTAQTNLAGLNFCIFDMEQSGAMMAWNYFHKSSTTPELIKYIQDRDLWQWELPESREVSSGLQLLPLDFDVWQEHLSCDSINKLKADGRIVLAYQNQQVAIATNQSKVRQIAFMGHIVPIVNSTTLISEVCGTLAKGNPFAVTYFDTPTERVYSLRSRKDGEDVSEIAKKFGGGGHRNASGFVIPLTEKQL